MERQQRRAWLHKSQSEWSGMCGAMSELLGRDVKCVTTSLQTHKLSRQEATPKEGQWRRCSPSAKRARYDLEETLPDFEFRPEEKSALQCSYEVAYRIAKCKNPHTIAEDLIKPCAEKMVELMIGPGAKKKIQQLSLSKDTIRRRIDATWLLIWCEPASLLRNQAKHVPG